MTRTCSEGRRRTGRRSLALPLAVLAIVALLQLLPPPSAAAEPATASGTTAPRDATTGYIIVGPAGATWPASGGGTLSLNAAAVENLTTKNSGDAGISINVWATPVADGLPNLSRLLNFSQLGGINLGPIKAGQSVTNISYSGLTYTQPKKGCYYVTLALLGQTLNTVDIWPFASGGVPSPTGYNVFSFGGASCAQTSPCEESAQTACLVGSRFQVNATYYNATDGKALAQVLSFGGTRAESDESIFYYFTDSSNFEMGVKVLDACSINNSYWVFLGGLTNQGWEVNVLDTQTGNFKTYKNNLNITTVTTTDTAALPCP